MSRLSSGLLSLLTAIALLGSSLHAAPPRLPRANPAAVGMDEAKLAEMRRCEAVPQHPELPVLGHLGYTGTSVRFSPELDLFFVFLSNRVHPKDPGSLTAIVSAVRRTWDATVQAIVPPIARTKSTARDD